MSWAINIGGLVYFAAMHAQLGVPLFYDEVWRWLLYQVFLVIPLALYAVVVGRQLLLLLSAAGLVVTVWRLSSFLVNLSDLVSAQILTRFVTMGLTGVGIIYGGIAYQQMAPKIKEQVEGCTRSCCGCLRKKSINVVGVAVPAVEMEMQKRKTVASV